MSSFISAHRLVMLFCVAVFSLGCGSAFSMDGIGTAPGTVKEKLKVKGCGSQRWEDEITGFSISYDGTWSLTTSGGVFTGTYSDIKPDKKFSLTLSPSSYSDLIAAIEAGSDELCELAAGTSTLTDITIKKFTAKLNKKWTAVSIKLAIAATRQDTETSNKTAYSMKGKIGFEPSGCSGETVGSLPGSDALVYCGNPDPAVISADNALELLADVIGSGSTGPVLSTASADGTRQSTATTVATAGLGRLARRLDRQLFDPGLYADARTDSESLAVNADAGLPVQAAAIKFNETESCDSGTLSLKGKLSNQGIGSLNLVFHDCLLEGDVFNGSAKLTISAFDLGYLTFTDAVLDFTMLSSSGVSGDILLSGSMRDQLDMAADTETLTLDLVIQDNTADRAYRAEGLVITTVYDDWQYPNSYNMAINGRLYDSTHGYVDATTLQPLAYSSLLQPYPDQGGSLSLTGANDAGILFTVLSTTTASLAVDTDGDGVSEYANIINTSVINGDTGTPAAPVAADVDDRTTGTSAPIQLDASGSFDANGDLLSYYWEVVSEPAAGAGTITAPQYPATEFQGSEPGIYVLRVTVSDGVNAVEDLVSVNLVATLVSTYTTHLDFQVIDAEYSNQLDRIVMVAANPDTLHVLDPVSGADTSVDLPLPPTSVSVGPDGQFAAVGHDGFVSYIDLTQGQLLSTYAVSTDVLDIVLAGNGYVYAFPRQDQWELIRCIELATGNETLQTSDPYRPIYAGTLARLHPDGTAIYGANNGLIPSDIEKYAITGGTAEYLYDSPYHGGYPMDGELWFTEDGSRIITRGGGVYQSSPVQADDMVYNGSLSGIDAVNYIRSASHSGEAGKLVVIPGSDDTFLRFFEDEFFAADLTAALPFVDIGGQAYATQGVFVFFNDSGDLLYVIARIDESAGLNEGDLVVFSAEYPP